MADTIPCCISDLSSPEFWFLHILFAKSSVDSDISIIFFIIIVLNASESMHCIFSTVSSSGYEIYKLLTRISRLASFNYLLTLLVGLKDDIQCVVY